MCEIAMLDYSASLDDVLQWSTGRIYVLWKRRIEREARQAEALARFRDASTNHDRGDRTSPAQNGPTKDITLAQLAKTMRVPVRPYPGRINGKAPQ